MNDLSVSTAASPSAPVQPTDWTSMEIEEVTHNGSSDPVYSPHSPRLFPRASSIYLVWVAVDVAIKIKSIFLSAKEIL